MKTIKLSSARETENKVFGLISNRIKFRVIGRTTIVLL